MTQNKNLNKNGRADETPRTWFRSERVYLIGEGAWYFRTREGVELGPYDSRFEAEIEAGLLREQLRGLGEHDEKMAVIKEFVLDAHATGQSLKPLCADKPQAASA